MKLETKKRAIDILFLLFIMIVISSIYFLSTSYINLQDTCINTQPISQNNNTKTIVIKQNVINTLRTNYDKEKEFFYCLNGTSDDTTIYIDDIVNASIIIQTKYNVMANVDMCSFGTVHSHPTLCIPSATDIFSWGEWHAENKSTTIDLIYCDNKIYAFYFTNSSHFQSTEMPL